jgi:quercetin dioxygenase-like cupin family protein
MQTAKIENLVRLSFGVLACIASFSIRADPPTEVMNITREAEVKWVQSPFAPGLATAVIAGNPNDPGKPYVVRARFSPGTFSPPHFHPETRYIVVLKGTWWVGSGPKWDKDATTSLPAGSFVVHHPNKVHYDGAKDEEVIVQISGVGPGTTTRVDESGQPKK